MNFLENKKNINIISICIFVFALVLILAPCILKTNNIGIFVTQDKTANVTCFDFKMNNKAIVYYSDSTTIKTKWFYKSDTKSSSIFVEISGENAAITQLYYVNDTTYVMLYGPNSNVYYEKQ